MEEPLSSGVTSGKNAVQLVRGVFVRHHDFHVKFCKAQTSMYL